MRVTFHGVRGSTPAIGANTARYGGNTACVTVEVPGAPPIVIDLGTGLRTFGSSFDGPFDGVMLLSHLHWDHIQGLPFFGPIMAPGARARLIGPPQEDGTLLDVLSRVVKPPFFPVPFSTVCASIAVEELDRASVAAGSATITACRVEHPGPTNAYRIDEAGADDSGVSVVYVSDHQQPIDGAMSAELLDMCRGVDLLIHDAQYTQAEFAAKSDWGHSTVDFAVEFALAARVKSLALFHHDPSRDDAAVDELVAYARDLASGTGLAVFAAAEGDSVSLLSDAG